MPPADDGGSAVTQFVVEKSEALSMSWVPAGTFGSGVTSGNISGLEEGVQYVFRVSAVNSVGSGPPAELQRAVAAKSAHCEYFIAFVIYRALFCH
jgi:titin